MVVKRARNRRTALLRASMARRNGLNASIFKKKKGFGVSITRGKK